MKFLIDECLSDELAKMAIAAGHLDASHVRWLGKGGTKDWTLKKLILEGDWTFVTRNSVDFRGAYRQTRQQRTICRRAPARRPHLSQQF